MYEKGLKKVLKGITFDFRIPAYTLVQQNDLYQVNIEQIGRCIHIQINLCVCACRCRNSVSTARKWWSLVRKCPSCSSCHLQMKCAQLLVRTTRTPPAPASSPCPSRSLNWVSIADSLAEIRNLTPTAASKSICSRIY